MVIAYLCISVLFSIFTYGFIDLHLQLTHSSLFQMLQKPLGFVVFQERPVATVLFLLFFAFLCFCYLWLLKKGEMFLTKKKLFLLVGGIALIFLFSFPAFSYDIFNYIATAKVTYLAKENPYLVMPIEIAGDPNLAFTRAANKVALYGPVWILLTAIPHFLGSGDIWLTIIAFKLLNAALYLFVAYLIYLMTKSLKNVLFFACNPLIIIEVLISSHNDITMMALVLLGIMLWQAKGIGSKVIGVASMVASVFVKGASVVILPLLFFKHISTEQFLKIAYILFGFVFFVAAPLREELYPWYAVWLIVIAACLNGKKHSFLFGFTVVLSFALELRQLPYMYMGYYEGVGPLARTLVTIIPIGLYLLFFAVRRLVKKGSYGR